MILQDLIRNYILYREVMRPILKLWKDSLAAGYYKGTAYNSSSEFNLALNKARVVGGGEELGWDISDEYEARALNKSSGTHTITTVKTLLTTEHDIFKEAKNKNIQAPSSKATHIVLAGSPYEEYIDKIGKTPPATRVLSTKTMVLCVTETHSLTTGFESKQINFYLISETHEKREYLGEFSLTHEENHLFTFKEGGGYHDTDQESITTVV